ncbi:hypothetical protein TSAR_003912 [Trichomalopsis sarcophagae]|uniref:Uncharacterized protein n=1 Tax=Trichomalopsis sarcophagae TaxID=543379 RepID=A0A232EK05_9HYME|nr:hypothetical protein TSAR_003912 [Trichomalopsis sarcophagae]
MVSKIAIIVLFACLAVALAKPAENPLGSIASFGINAVRNGVKGVSKGFSDTYEGTKQSVDNTVESAKDLGQKGIETGFNIGKNIVRTFTKPVELISIIAGNIGKH